MGIFLLFGFYSLLAQVLLVREISQLFSAHELSLAAALAAWLLWTAAGARLAAAKTAGARLNFPAAALLLAALAPANLLLARLAPALPGGLSQPGLFSMAAGSLLLALPCGLANGYAAGAGLAGRPAFFYAAEAAGAAAAGMFTVLYFRYFPSLEPVLALALPGLGLGAFYAAQAGSVKKRLYAAAALLAACALAVAAAPLCYTLKPPAPRPARVALTGGSRLAFTGGAERAVYEDGRLLNSAGDTGPEELAHIPLLASPGPGRVLLTGGGAFFILPEVLKHRPSSVEIAEPDRFKARALAAWAGARNGTCALLPLDPRELKGRSGFYDVIFQTDASPDNAALNRSFTLEYFRLAAGMLAPGGILAFQLPFAENYLPRETAYAAACVLASAKAVFPYIELVPGRRLTVLASLKPIKLELPLLARRYSERGIKNRTVTTPAFPFMLDPYRRAWAEMEIARVKHPPLNTDLNPLAYFRFWRAWLSMVASPPALLGLAALGLAAVLGGFRVAGLLGFTPEDRSGEAFFMGFWALAFETSLLLAFQAGTGRLNPELGLLFAVFMAGGAAGAWAGGKSGGGILAAELAAAALAFGCAGAPAMIAGGAWVWAFIAAAGTLTGFFFSKAAGSGPAGIYALDLVGGAAGGLVTAAFSAPLWGISGALHLAGAAAGAALAGGLLVALRRRRAAGGPIFSLRKKRPR